MDRTALVTGGNRGIGFEACRQLARAGPRVVLTARDPVRGEEAAEALRDEGLDVSFAELDVTDSGSVGACARRLSDAGTDIDVLVNNAGVFSGAGPSHLLDAAAVDSAFAVNVRPVLLLTGVVAAGMAARGNGSVVTVSSAAGQRGTPFTAAYAATKGALDAATRALAAEHGPAGVRVNAVLPGITVTSMTGRLFDDPAVVAHYTDRVALRRMGRPEDIADVVAFLASDAAGYVTAQTLVVDGGWADTGAIFPAPA